MVKFYDIILQKITCYRYRISACRGLAARVCGRVAVLHMQTNMERASDQYRQPASFKNSAKFSTPAFEDTWYLQTRVSFI